MTQQSHVDNPELDDDIPIPIELSEAILELEPLIVDLEEDSLQDSERVLKIYDVAEGLADQLKDLRFRGSIGSKTQIIPSIVRAIEKIVSFCLQAKLLLAIQPIAALRQLLRIIGNLVHTADLNRRRYLDANGAQALKSTMDLLLTLENRQIDSCQEEIQISLLVATNLSLDYQPAIVALAETGLSATLSAIIEYAYSHRLQWMSLPLILLDELVTIDAALNQIPDSLLCNLAQMVVYYAGKIESDRNESNPHLQILLMCAHLLDTIVDHANSSRFTHWLFVPCDPSHFSFSDDVHPPMWMRLLAFLRVANSSTQAATGVSHTDDAPGLFSLIKAQISRAIVVAIAYSGVTLNKSMPMMEILVDWMGDSVVCDDRPDLIILISLWLGNLACDEQSCRFLVEDCQVLTPLITIFRKWVPSSLQSQADSSSVQKKPGQQAQVLHACCGLARNLAVADTYKSRLGELGIVKYALECFQPEFDIVEPLSGTAAALLRHLCRNHADNVERVVESSQVNAVVNLARRAEQPHLMLESCRLLSVLINTAAQIDQSKSRGTDEGFKILYSETTVDALVRFACVSVTSNQLVLINEALISLALLAVRPELAHSLCSNLIKVRDPLGSATAASDLLPSPDENKQQQGSSEQKKKSFRNTLEALLSIWLPSSDLKEKVSSRVKKDDDAITLEKQNVAKNEEDEAHSLLELLNNQASSSSEQVQPENRSITNKNETPIQIKENLKVVLIQLGKRSIVNQAYTAHGESNVHNDEETRGDNIAGNKQGEVQEIRNTLLNHYNSFHSKCRRLKSDRQAKHEEKGKKNMDANAEGDYLNISKTLNGHEVDEICCKTDGVKITSTNNESLDGNEDKNGNGADVQDQIGNMNTSFSIVEVLQAWGVEPNDFPSPSN